MARAATGASSTAASRAPAQSRSARSRSRSRWIDGAAAGRDAGRSAVVGAPPSCPSVLVTASPAVRFATAGSLVASRGALAVGGRPPPPRYPWCDMASVWTRLEPHLAGVEKPARYIGLELGAQRPDPGQGAVSWLLTYPDTYKIGLPNQGLQILYEILNERDDAAAERSYAPWGDL